MNDHEAQIQTAIRLPESLLKRIDRLAKGMSTPGIRITRADVLRRIAVEGVDRLEAEQKKR